MYDFVVLYIDGSAHTRSLGTDELTIATVCAEECELPHTSVGAGSTLDTHRVSSIAFWGLGHARGLEP
eukprot:3756404-Amphidinium_carterae.1